MGSALTHNIDKNKGSNVKCKTMSLELYARFKIFTSKSCEGMRWKMPRNGS